MESYPSSLRKGTEGVFEARKSQKAIKAQNSIPKSKTRAFLT
jgi:hypothetical protein